MLIHHVHLLFWGKRCLPPQKFVARMTRCPMSTVFPSQHYCGRSQYRTTHFSKIDPGDIVLLFLYSNFHTVVLSTRMYLMVTIATRLLVECGRARVHNYVTLVLCE